MTKLLYSGLGLVIAYMVLIMLAVAVLMISGQCNILLGTCDKDLFMGVLLTIIVAATAVATAAVVEGVLYHRQTKASKANHEQQMKAIKRLEAKIDKNLGGRE